MEGMVYNMGAFGINWDKLGYYPYGVPRSCAHMEEAPTCFWESTFIPLMMEGG